MSSNAGGTPPSNGTAVTSPNSPSIITANAKAAIDANPHHILHINFNQDSKVIEVGHKDGFMYYKTAEILDNTNLQYEGENSSNPFLNGCLVVERLFSSALMITVSYREPRVLHVYHFTSRNIICDHKFKKAILTVKLNRERIVVCLEDSIFIYNLKDMKLMHNILDTPANKLGLIDLTLAQAFMAYPGSTDNGSVHIFDAMSLCSVNTFVAHDGSLAALKFNADGSRIATASTKGTVIRVYSVPDGTRLFEFRRGMSRCVTIHSLAFSTDNMYLCSASNTETVHVFKLEKNEEIEKKPEVSPEPAGWFDAINRTVSAYMPTQVSELITTERSFATAKLPGTTKKNLASLFTHKDQTYVVVATAEGFVYCYRLDSNGGELDLVKQHKVGPHAESSCRGPLSPGGGTDATNCADIVPDMDDPDDFPPMSHSSG